MTSTTIRSRKVVRFEYLRGMEIRDGESLGEAQLRLSEMVNGGEGDRALAFAEELCGDGTAVLQLRAWTSAEVGGERDDLKLLARAQELWAELSRATPDSPEILYNEGSTAESTFRALVRTRGHAAALETQRRDLDRARESYLTVAEDARAGEQLRLQALTNLANSFDTLGRDLESIEAYDKALAIDPGFGMALGNKGLALVEVAHLADGHSAAVLDQARRALDAALADREGIVAVGGPSAYERFAALRERIRTGGRAEEDGHSGGHASSADDGSWTDPYLDWCRRESLFLHVSHGCLSEDDELLDPLFFRRVINKIGEDEEFDRVAIFQDAFNSIKQDFIAARYSAWLVSAEASPIREQAAATSSRTRFLDSLSYARWGTRVGMATQAFAAAANLLDKIACFTHLYLGTGRVKDVYFSSFWHPRGRRDDDKRMEAAFRAELKQGDSFNRGLLALCDLSCDLERNSRLAELIRRRHSATHRFLVVHEWDPVEAPSGEFLDRVSHAELIDGLIWLLRTARSGLIYLARSVEIREDRLGREAEAAGEIIPTLPAFHAVSELPN